MTVARWTQQQQFTSKSKTAQWVCVRLRNFWLSQLQPSAISMVAEGGPGGAGREQSAPIHEAAARGNDEAVAELLAAGGGGAATTALW